MSIPVPFGQYVPGDSAIHRLDARAKIGCGVALTVALFSARGWAGLALCTLSVGVVLAASRVPVRYALRGVLPVAWLLAFTIVANSVRIRPEAALAMLGPVGITADGLARGSFFALRILVLVIGTSLVTLTTSPVALTDALALIARPLARFGFPSDDAAMMLSIAMRFIPTTAEEAERVIVAQTARGARFDVGGPIARARAWVPVLVPLFVRLFRRAEDLALAMESRAYGSGRRTRLREPSMTGMDWVALAASALVVIVVAGWL